MQLPLLDYLTLKHTHIWKRINQSALDLLGIMLGGLKCSRLGTGYCSSYTCCDEGQTILHNSLNPHRSEKWHRCNIAMKCQNVSFQEKCKFGSSDGESWIYSFSAVYQRWASVFEQLPCHPSRYSLRFNLTLHIYHCNKLRMRMCWFLRKGKYKYRPMHLICFITHLKSSLQQKS